MTEKETLIGFGNGQRTATAKVGKPIIEELPVADR